MKIVQVSRENSFYRAIRDKHYIKNKGTIGKQIHYLIYEGDELLQQPIGIIAGASAV